VSQGIILKDLLYNVLLLTKELVQLITEVASTVVRSDEEARNGDIRESREYGKALFLSAKDFVSGNDTEE